MSANGVGSSLAASALWGTSDFLGGSLSRRLRTVHVLAGSQGTSLLVLAVVVLATGAHATAGPWLWWSIGAGAAWAVGMGSLYSALASGHMGVVAAIASAGSVVPVVVGLALGERPGALALLGVLVALGGVVASAGPELGGATAGRRRAVGLAVVAAVLFGVEVVLLAEASRTSVPLSLVGMRGAALVCLAVALVVEHRLRPVDAPLGPSARDVPALVVLGGLDLAATGAYALSARTGDLSLVAVLASLYPAVTVVLARLVHGERLVAVQRLGVVAVLVGAACAALAGA